MPGATSVPTKARNCAQSLTRSRLQTVCYICNLPSVYGDVGWTVVETVSVKVIIRGSPLLWVFGFHRSHASILIDLRDSKEALEITQPLSKYFNSNEATQHEILQFFVCLLYFTADPNFLSIQCIGQRFRFITGACD